MRGHNAILELRRMGKKPTHVFVFVLPEGAKPLAFIDPEELMDSALQPEVHVACNERIEALDFRFLTGVTVHLSGTEPDRLREAYAQIVRCKPARLITCSPGQPGIFHDT